MMPTWIIPDFFHSTQGLSVTDQEKIDQYLNDLDGTENKCE